MKSRTSFFNTTVLKKDITRFAPVWGLYSVGLLLLLLGFVDGSDRLVARSLENLCDLAALIQLFYGAICAAMLFGELFSPRMCNALHAMPLRREGWFLNRLAAGLLFFLVPTGIFSLLLIPLAGSYWYAPLLFLAISLLSFLFFFGTAALCALCAGNRLGMAALYGILQFFPLFVYCLVWVFYEPFLYGLPLEAESFLSHSPVIALTDCGFLEISYARDLYDIDAAYAPLVVSHNLQAWRYLGWTAGVGLVSLGLTVVLYRRRDLETAGDFLAFRWVKPVFLGIYCLAVGMLLYLLGEAFDTGLKYFFLLVGLAVGFFTGRMLLRRTVRVFQGKAFVVFGLILALLGVSVGAMAADLLGIVRRVPREAVIEKVELSSNYGWGYPVELTEAEDIRLIRSIHETCVEQRQEGNVAVELRYTLKNGGSVHRAYRLPADSRETEALRRYFSSRACVLGTDTPEEFLSRVQGVYVDQYDIRLSKAEVAGLVEAVCRDCDAGTMAQDYNFHREELAVTWLEFTLDVGGETGLREYRNINVYESCVNTLEYLEQLLKQYGKDFPE